MLGSSSRLLSRRLAPAFSSNLRTLSTAAPPPSDPLKVCFIGSGNWGSAAGWVAAQNTLRNPDYFNAEVNMYVHDEIIDGANTDEVLMAWETISPFLSERDDGTIDATAIQLMAAEVSWFGRGGRR